MKWAVMKKKTDGFTPQEKAIMEELCSAMLELLTKPYEYHMIDFLCDAENYFGMTEQDFTRWEASPPGTGGPNGTAGTGTICGII